METKENIPDVLMGLMVRKPAVPQPRVDIKIKTDTTIRELDMEDKRKTMNINYVSVHDKVRRQLGNVVMKMKFASDSVDTNERLPIVEYNMKLDEEFEEKPVEEVVEKKLEEVDVDEVEKETKKVAKEEEAEEDVVPKKVAKEEVAEDATEEDVVPKKGPAKKIPKKAVGIATGRMPKTEINGRPIDSFLPKQTPIEKLIIRAPTYYMNNRKMYTQKLVSLFKSYFAELEETAGEITCESRTKGGFDALIHQRIVRDYLNLYTPYRGLLLYHGLGSGKTCTSIAIAEGMKTHKKVIVMTPASLKMNFFSELKKCGDVLYKKNQYWQFISVEGNPDYIPILSQALSLPVEFIMENRGAWLMDIKQKTPNYGTLTGQEQKVLDKQLDTMIRTKYIDINYNGLTQKKYNEWTRNDEINPFDHSVVLIDEAHNLISRIMNKLNSPSSLAYKLYQKLLVAQDVRIVLMSGTPIINYPHEIAILFNILRGSIKTWTFKIKSKGKLEEQGILNLLEKSGITTYDYINYAAGKLTITRNPFGFINVEKAAGMKLAPALEDKPARKIKVAAPPPAKPQLGGEDANDAEHVSLSSNMGLVDVEPAPQHGSGGVGSGRRKKGTTKLHVKETRKTKKLREPVYDEKRDVVQIDTTESELVEPMESTIPEEMEKELERERLNMVNNMGEDNIHRGGAVEINPKYSGVKLDQQGNISDSDFLKSIERVLESGDIHIEGEPVVSIHKCLPDSPIDFNQAFIDEQTLMFKRSDIFKKRILGLTSYFRSAQEALLPRFVLTEDGNPYHIVKVEMSDYQFSVYAKVREEELTSQKEMSSAKKMAVFKVASSYRTRSRAASNFTFPAEIERPLPQHMKEADKGKIQAADLDNIQDDNELDMEENGTGKILSVEYAKKIQEALNEISKHREGDSSPYLTVEGLRNLSPKFLKIMQTVQDPENEGLHLVYSAFRSVEGIGLLRLIFMANGYAEFKLHKSGDTWNIEGESNDKPHFVLYTGTETAEEKELIRNIYNSNWDALPINISSKLREKAENNYYGDIIKVFMITSSGAEGINLENTRFVHVVEPYWHMVRIDQVVGRARRICSHMNLPEELRTLKVFIYLATFTESQKNNKNQKIMTSDVSRLTGQPCTTDESLFEIATIKDGLIRQIMKSVKETAIDCQLYAKSNRSENLVCYGYGKTERNEFGSYPTFEEDQQFIEDVGVREKKVEIGKKEYEGKTYVFNKTTKEIYEPVAIKQGTVIVIGHMEKRGRELVPVLDT